MAQQQIDAGLVPPVLFEPGREGRNMQCRRAVRIPQVHVGTCVEIKFYGAFVLTRRVYLHAIDSASARWRGDAGSSPLDGAVHPTHWLISTQVDTRTLERTYVDGDTIKMELVLTTARGDTVRITRYLVRSALPAPAPVAAAVAPPG